MIVGGIVLCGGQSKRMGQPKAWLPFGDELMLPRVVRLLGGAVRPRVVVAAPDQDLPPLAAVYRLDVLDTVTRLLNEDRLRPFFLFESVPTRIVTEEELCDIDPTFQTLRNLNTPEDYEAALRDQ